MTVPPRRLAAAAPRCWMLGSEQLSMPIEAGTAPGITGGELQNFLTPPGQALLAPDTLKELKASAGAVLTTDAGLALPPLTPQPELVPGVLVVDIGIAQHLLNKPDQLSKLLIGSADRGPRAELRSVVGDQLRYVAADDATDLERLTDSFHLNLTAFGLLSFLVGLFIVNSAIGLAFEQRRPMLRTLRACGASAAELNAVLITELLLLSLLGGLIGLIGGYFIAAALLPDVAATLRGLYGAQLPGQLSLRPSWWFAGLAISVIGALTASTAGLLKASRLPVLTAAQPRAWQDTQQRWLLLQGGAALALALVGALLVWLGDSLTTGFAVLATILLGAALGLPAVLGVLLRLGERLTSRPVATWFWADSRLQLSGLSLALMALLLALGVNVGVGTMVQSFSRTFNVWLDGRLAAEVYVSAADEAQAAEINALLRDRPQVQAVLPGVRAEVKLEGWPTDLLGFADHATYRDNWPLLQATTNSWDRLAAGDGVMVSEQLARRMKLKLGDRLQVPTPNGIWPLDIVAIYADYGNPRGQLGVGIDALVGHFPGIAQTRFGLRVTPEAVPALVSELRDRFHLDNRSLADQTLVKTESKRIFNRTFAVTNALNAFTLGIAGVALFTSLLTLSQSRLPQLAPLWALGLTRRKLALLELGKTMAMALITALLALPLGLLVAWCLIAVVNVKAFGWRLPFAVFPTELAQLLAVALLAALLAALLPIIKLLRTQPAQLVKVFADER